MISRITLFSRLMIPIFDWRFIILVCQFLTREYTKRNERVIGMDGNFTNSLTRSLASSIHHSDVNFRSLKTPLVNA